MNNQNMSFGQTPPIKKIKKSKNTKQLILMNDQFILIDPFILKEYNLFSQNTEGSLEQLKRNFAFMKKVNHSIAAKMCANLLNNR